jgi:uncharacterized protein (TIGR03790 family)
VKRVSVFNCSSVESELTLILGPYANSIGGYGRIVSPYYGKKEDFTRAKFGLYLVNRLDGYSVSDVKALIDRAAIVANTVPAGARFVLDQDPTWTATVPYLNTNMVKAATQLQSRDLAVTVDSTTMYLTQQTNVLGYVSWGSNDRNCSAYATNAVPMNRYLNGAIVETYVSTSARTFNAPVTYGQSVIADLIAEGVTAAKGYAYEPYSSAMADVSILFPMYADGFTVAESFYASSYYLSWMDVVVGDPKYRTSSVRMPADVTPSDSSGANPLPVQLTSLTASVNGMNVVINWNTATEMNCYGFEVERREVRIQNSESSVWIIVGFVAGNGTSSISHRYDFTEANLALGRYVYRLKQIDQDGRFEYFGNVEVVVDDIPAVLSLSDNFPNPFNPETGIRYQVAGARSQKPEVSLKVYDVLGREVAVLVDQAQEPGSYQVKWNAAGFPSGVYFYRLSTGQSQIVKRMVLAK